MLRVKQPCCVDLKCACVRALGRTFSWKTKHDSRAVACSTVRSLNRPLKIISVSSSSSPLGSSKRVNDSQVVCISQA